MVQDINNNDTQQKYNRYNEEDNSSINIVEIFRVIWSLKFWILLLIVIFLGISVLIIKSSPHIYSRSTKILLNNEESGLMNLDDVAAFTDLSGFKNNKIENELLVLNSRSLMCKVVDNLSLNVRYFVEGNIFVKNIELYKNSPIKLVYQLDSVSYNKKCFDGTKVEFKIKPKDKSRYQLEYVEIGGDEVNLNKKEYYFGQIINLPGMNATLELSNIENLEIGKFYTITKESFNHQVSENIRALSAEHTVKGSDAITITYKDNIIERADDILNNLVYQYNVDARMFKNASVINTIDFLNDRLSVLSKELSDIESSFKDYKESNVVVNPESESELTLQTGAEYQKQLSDLMIQQQILNLILEQINQPIDSTGGFIPENIGMSDIGINASITQYNKLISERNRLLASSSPNNPRVVMISSQIQDLKAGISLSLSNFKNTLDIRRQELVELVDQEKKKISAFPSLQLDLQKISRQQQIIEPLYLLLQQKKEEAQILLYAASDNARVIENSYGSLVPVKPKKNIIYLLAILLGFATPVLFVFLRKLFKTKVYTPEDVTNNIDAPLLATIAFDEDSDNKLEDSADRNVTYESFRMLRSKLEYIPGNVFQVTSSFPKEGKTYVSVNLAIFLSLINKKVLLIGLDLRKPKIRKFFSEDRRLNKVGIVNYLSGMTDNIESEIINFPEYPNLDVLFSGPIPPNPAELLSLDKMGEVIEKVRKDYDYVICDSSPFLLVSDALIMNKYVDATLYVIRSGETSMRLLPEIQNVTKNVLGKGTYVILNAYNFKTKKYGYGYGYGGYGYGYGGYGYGYGYGYEYDKSKKKFRLFKRKK